MLQLSRGPFLFLLSDFSIFVRLRSLGRSFLSRGSPHPSNPEFQSPCASREPPGL